MSDNQPRKGLPCQVCAHDLDAVLPAQGQYTHPTCDPQLTPTQQGHHPGSRNATDVGRLPAGSGSLLDLYGNPRADL